MMAYLMHQDMFDDSAKRLVVLGPIIENWAPVEPDHVRHLDGGASEAEMLSFKMEIIALVKSNAS